MRLYPNIGLAQMNEGGDKENGVRVQIANPDLIVKKKTLKKRMNGNPKSRFEIILKDYDLTGAGVRVTLSFWCPPAAEFLVVQKPHSDEVVEVPRGAPRLLPLFGHRIGPFLRITLRHCRSRTSFELGVEHLGVLRTVKAGGSSAKGRRLLCNYWVKNMDATSGHL